jgi:hypothetical protein
MNPAAAQALAQLLSVIIFAAAAVWYIAPRLRRLARADALILPLWVGVFRFVTLQTASAQQAGFPISDAGRNQVIVAGLIGTSLAFAAIVALRFRLRFAVPMAWLFVLETVVDVARNVADGMRERLFGLASGVTWMVLSFYVPLVLVSVGLLIWQLWVRRREPLALPGQQAGASSFGS